MTGLWWIVPVVLVAVLLLASVVWPSWCRRRDAARFRRARQLFHLRREWLEADFVKLAGRLGKPRGLVWRDCDFENEAAFATDRSTGELRAFVGLTISFEPEPGFELEHASNAGRLRAATAVFLYDGRGWTTDGRVLFNLNPLEAIERFHHELERAE